MLELPPNCECCNCDLAPDTTDADICSFECTFCVNYATTVHSGQCPNCGGHLVSRPIRPPNMLSRHPASTKRVGKIGGCISAA